MKVDVKFVVLALLPPEDICRLGATSRHWRALVRDPVLWRYLLLRDMPRWPSVDHVSMPKLEALTSPLCGVDLEPEDRVEGEEPDSTPRHNYMAEWVHRCLRGVFVLYNSTVHLFTPYCAIGT